MTGLAAELLRAKVEIVAWGEDGTVLVFTARTSVYRMPTKTQGKLLG